MNRITNRKQQHTEDRKWSAPLALAVFRFIMTIFICLAIWSVLSLWIHESLFGSLHQGEDGITMLLFAACVLDPLLLFPVSATRQVVQKTREHYFPLVNSDPLPAEEVLLRGAEPPSATSETLLRPSRDNAQTPAEYLLRATNGAGSEQP